MRLFVTRGYHLASLNPLAKVTYTVFLVFIALGLWTSWEIYATRIGDRLEGPAGTPSVAERYVEAPRPAATAPGDGPQLDLPGLDGGEEGLPSDEDTANQDVKGPWVLDVFHQHTFSVSVVFLILAHLFMLTRLHAAVAGAVITLAGLSALAHVLAPVIVHETGGALWLMPVSGALMGLSWTAMVLWSLVAMWLGVGASRERPTA